jgi:hypothetical protein
VIVIDAISTEEADAADAGRAAAAMSANSRRTRMILCFVMRYLPGER